MPASEQRLSERRYAATPGGALMPQSQTLTPMILANDKLLKALITLLVLRDEHLMSELRTIFVVAHRNANPIGSASNEVWTHLRDELDLIASLVGDTDDEEVAVSAPN
jgi:hypothetical protein